MSHRIMHFAAVDMLTEAERSSIFLTLREHNRQSNPAFWTALDDSANAARPLHVIARKGEEVAGGFIGTTQLLWLKVEILSVASQFRRQGVGSRLMAIAEVEAARRGCKYAYVDTMEYQAPTFYEALGYQVAGRLDDWDSHGHDKYFLKKTLRP